MGKLIISVIFALAFAIYLSLKFMINLKYNYIDTKLDTTGKSKSEIESDSSVSSKGIAIYSSLFKNEQPMKINGSVAYPYLMSKRYASRFRITLYPTDMREEALERLVIGIEESQLEDIEINNELRSGQTVVISFYSQDIEFGKDVIKKLDNMINTTTIIGKPKDESNPGKHIIKLSVTDKVSGHEYVSHTFLVEIVDYAFDHISRPLLSKVSSLFLSTAAISTYALTFLEQLDKAFGYTAGTVAVAASGFVYARYQYIYNLFRRTSSISL